MDSQQEDAMIPEPTAAEKADDELGRWESEGGAVPPDEAPQPEGQADARPRD
jgi:hypothetical protein